MTPMALLQDAAVTLVALGAAATLARRILAFVKPRRGGEVACSSCPSATPRRTERAGTPDTPQTHPVAFIRRRVS